MLIKMNKGLLIVPLSAYLLLPSFTTNASAEEVGTKAQQQQQLAKSQAMNSSTERQKLKEMGLDPNNLPLKPGKPLTVNFEDGSKIVYEMSVTNTVSNSSAIQATTGDFETMGTTYKTYKVNKIYFYLLAKASIYLYTDVKHVNRSVTVRKHYPGFIGVFAKNDRQSTRTIDGYGENNDYATTEVNGQFTLGQAAVGDLYTKSYVLRMDIDPAGGAYLRVIQ